MENKHEEREEDEISWMWHNCQTKTMTNISDNIWKIVYTYILLKIITTVPCTSSLRENFLPDVNKDTKMIQQAVDRHILMQYFARMRRILL